jgi:hypothetical protein
MSSTGRHLTIINRSGSSILQSNHHEPTTAEIARGRMRDRQRKRNRDRSMISTPTLDATSFVDATIPCRPRTGSRAMVTGTFSATTSSRTITLILFIALSVQNPR